MSKIHAIYQGKLSPIDEIKVSPLSRAYTFSDSIYEVIPYFSGQPLCFKEHINRMRNSAEKMNLNVDFDTVTNEISTLAEALSLKNGYVYYQISRGIDIIRSHMYEHDIEIEKFGYALPMDFPSSSISAMLCDDDRWGRCDIKSTSLLGNVLSMNQA